MIKRILAASASIFLLGASPDVDETNWEPAAKEHFEYVVDRSYESDISPFVIMGIIKKESSWKIKSHTYCCYGYGQIHEQHGYDIDRLMNDPEYSIDATVEYFKRKLVQYDWNTNKALDAYRGIGYEPSYDKVVLEYAENYRKDWEKVKQED